jgi:hypothetical protein
MPHYVGLDSLPKIAGDFCVVEGTWHSGAKDAPGMIAKEQRRRLAFEYIPVGQRSTPMPRQVRAVVVDPAAPDRLAIELVELRDPDRDEVTVRVTAISLNRGETRRAVQQAEPGWRPGWDFVGVTETAAAGKRRSRATWSDLTQTVHPPRPAVACNLVPAGSLSHECGLNSSRASSKLPSRTSSSIPP